MARYTLLRHLCLVSAVALLSLYCPVSSAQESSKVERIPIPNSDFPISQGVWVRTGVDTLYLSGMLAPVIKPTAPKGSVESYGDTKTQTIGVMQRISAALAAQKLGLGDVVMMHCYLAGDPAKGGALDFAGFMEGYSQFFGTKDQPNKPARSAMQVAALVLPGTLVEIEVIAVKH